MRLLPRLFALLLAGTAVAAQNGTLAVPANIKAEGVPPIPSAVVEKLAPYARFARTTLLDWHPEKNEILAYTVPAGERPRIAHVTSPSGAPQLLGDEGVSGGAASFGASPEYFVYRRDAAGAERYQLFRFDLASGTSTLLTDGKSRHGIPVWSPRGNRIAFSSNRRNGRDWDLYVMEVADPASARKLFDASGTWSVADWSPDEKKLLAVESLPGVESAIWEVELETGAKTLVSDKDSVDIWRAPQYTPDGASIIVVSNRGSDQTRVWKRTKGAWTPVTRDGDAVDVVSLSPDGKLLAVVFDRDASSRLELLDAATMKLRQAPALPAGTISGLRWNRGGTTLGFSFNTLQTASDVYAVDAKSGTATRWTESVAGGIDPAALPHPEIIRWKSFDGRTISGVLYRPPSKFAGPRPVMINIHGGPAAREFPRFQGRSGYFLNEQGVAIIFPNVRGSSGFGRAFEKLDDQRKREDAVKDVGALLDWIATQKELDSKRVMVMGPSYGGYLTYAVAATYPDRVRCALAVAAISDFVTYMATTEEGRVADRRAEYGDERDPEMKAFMTRISPVTYAAKITAPLMIAHGAKDIRVPLSQAEAMYTAVKKHNPNVWMVTHADEGHESIANPMFTYYAWITFVEKFLLNPDPS